MDIEGDIVVLSGNEERIWVRDLRRDPRVTLTVADRNNPYFWVEVKGLVIEDTDQGALEHVHKLAKNYMGEEEYPFLKSGEHRVICRVAAEKFRAGIRPFWVPRHERTWRPARTGSCIW